MFHITIALLSHFTAIELRGFGRVAVTIQTSGQEVRRLSLRLINGYHDRGSSWFSSVSNIGTNTDHADRDRTLTNIPRYFIRFDILRLNELR